MKTLLVICLVIVGFIAYAVCWPSRFDPLAWQGPPADKPAVASQPMRHLLKVANGAGAGPETIAIGPRGQLYAGYADGTIRRFAPNQPQGGGQVVATTNGRPLGLAFGPPPPASKTHRRPAGTSSADKAAASAANTTTVPARSSGQERTTLYVADADQGLLAINPQGEVSVLATGANGKPFAFTDDVAVADDGRVYFTDASSRWGQANYRTAILEHHGDGRLLRYDPSTGRTKVLMGGLQFANGVALGNDDAYVLVTESGAYRVRRYWLKGPHAGQSDVFIKNLPGFPDGIDPDGRGRGFWIALFAPRNSALDFTAPYPWMRRVVYRLPRWAQPSPARVGHILHVNNDGRVTTNRVSHGDKAYAPITSVTPYGNWLYLGSLQAHAIGRISRPNMP